MWRQLSELTMRCRVPPAGPASGHRMDHVPRRRGV